MRLFFAVKLTDEVNGRIGEAVRRLKPGLEGKGLRVSWVREENLHVTLKFLGEVADAVVPALREAGASVARAAASALVEARGMGAFPNETHPRVIWAGVRDESGLIPRLAHGVEDGLELLGFKRDPHGYTPHVTVGRVKEGRASVGEALFPFKQTLFGSATISEMVLYQSITGPEGSRYVPVERFQLSGESRGPEASSKDGSDRP